MKAYIPLLGLALGAQAAAQPPTRIEEARNPKQTLLRRVDAAILGAAKWLESAAIETEHGLRWPADPKKPSRVDRSLYAGGPGVALFFGLLASAEKDPDRKERWRSLAMRGAKQLIADVADAKWKQAGLYTGLAGTGTVLLELADRLDDKELRRAAYRAVDRLDSLAKNTEAGLRWNASNDVISGSAGTGLFLLRAHAVAWRDLDRVPHKTAIARLRKTARLTVRCGTDLLSQSISDDPKAPSERMWWRMSPGYRRDMPNFSHGTAGIAFFLARLKSSRAWREHGRWHSGSLRGSQNRTPLEWSAWISRNNELAVAAAAGGRHLIHRAKNENGGCLIGHHTPGGEQLFYLGWCHGPAGTARLFWQLGGDDWFAWARAGAESLLRSGIPQKRTPGFWQNVSTCCGTAGVLDFFVDLGRQSKLSKTDAAKFAAFEEQLIQDILDRATSDEGGTRWIQCEHRVRPKLRIAQCGWMQGAAGIAARLLEWRQERLGKPLGFYLPDELGPRTLARKQLLATGTSAALLPGRLPKKSNK